MSVADDPETQRLKKNMQVVSNVAYHNTLQEKARMEQNRPNEETDNFAEEAEVFDDEKQNHQSRRQIGSIADYDPIPNQILAAQPTGYQSVPSQQPRSPAMFAPTPYSPPGQFSSVQRQIGSVNFNPMPNSSPAPSSQYTSQPQARPGQGSMYTPFRPVQAPQPPKQNKGIVSQALYDYAAADTDEVSFMENDVIINCEPVDDGWMYGTVERTNKRGMLPSNYVQRLN